MSFILQAPMPNLQTTIVLPSPQFNDSQSPRSTVEIKQSMNGTLYSYVKSNARQRLVYTFQLRRLKALELRAFILAYYRAQVRITNHLGEVWDVYFTVNPFEFSGAGRDVNEVTLECDGILVSPVAPSQCS